MNPAHSGVNPTYPGFAVAPMMDWTDRHCRYFHRQLSQSARLYTEMIVAAGIRRGDPDHLLGFDALEHPVALQLGGNEPAELAHAARIGESFGYDEINLNCGCPSDRVREGAFGACLMREPGRVADCVRAMVDTVSVPVTVKHRIGLDRDECYGFVRDFVGAVADAGAAAVFVHARNAWLDGLNPKQNRTVPPLRYAVVHRLKQDFPALPVWLNGGLVSHEQIGQEIAALDGAMVGRAAYESPWLLHEVDGRYSAGGLRREARPGNGPTAISSRLGVAEAMTVYARAQLRAGVPLHRITRHMLGLFNGLRGARRWRRMLSDSTRLGENDADLILRCAREVEQTLPVDGPAPVRD